jgi:hypothetical protein
MNTNCQVQHSIFIQFPMELWLYILDLDSNYNKNFIIFLLDNKNKNNYNINIDLLKKKYLFNKILYINSNYELYNIYKKITIINTWNKYMNTYLSIYNIQFDSNENKYENILSYLFYEYLTDKIINVKNKKKFKNLTKCIFKYKELFDSNTNKEIEVQVQIFKKNLVNFDELI